MVSFVTLSQNVLSSEEDALEWMRAERLVRSEMVCPVCGRECRESEKMWKCRRSGPQAHVFQQSIFNNSWFGGSRWNKRNIICLTYMFSVDTYRYINLGDNCQFEDKRPSDRTLADWISYCREVCNMWVEQKEQTEGFLGGVGETVEIDQVHLGRRKNNVGRVVKGIWALGIVETLAGPRRGGGGTGANTQTVGSLWRALRCSVNAAGGPHETLHLRISEFIWRREVSRLGQHHFESFLDLLRQFYDPYRT
ncbi:hypothetical protein Btru_073862 [Bulinus truncatus]|nr:hypothetical protein Btru_073862 [Bulinus truncatus]